MGIIDRVTMSVRGFCTQCGKIFHNPGMDVLFPLFISLAVKAEFEEPRSYGDLERSRQRFVLS